MLYALGLIDTGYRFGGKNPRPDSTAAAWSASSMTGRRACGFPAALPTSFATAARSRGKTSNPATWSFQHAQPVLVSSASTSATNACPRAVDQRRVRIDRLTDRYYAQRFEAGAAISD